MTNGELIMQKAKQVLAYCNTFTQDEFERSFFDEIDLEEESAKMAKEVIEKEMFDTKYSNNVNKAYIDMSNGVSIYIAATCFGNVFRFDIGDTYSLNPINDSYIIDMSDIITISKNEDKHVFFNKYGVFYISLIFPGRFGRFFE